MNQNALQRTLGWLLVVALPGCAQESVGPKERKQDHGAEKTAPDRERAVGAKRDRALAPPFTVVLPDGRKAVITPNLTRIGAYPVTGEYFEASVREALAELFVEDPAKVHVLGGIPVPGGHVPNAWGPDHIHISLGEPLDHFARVELRGRKGPQAAELERMRNIRALLNEAVDEERNTPRKLFETRFGAGKPCEDVEKQGWLYPVGTGHLQVWYDRFPETITTIYPWSGPEPPYGQLRDYGKEARAVWKMDRAFLLAFLQKKFQGATLAEKAKLRAYLNKTNSVVKWTQQERKQFLSGSTKRRR